MWACLILNVIGSAVVSEGPSPNPDGGKPKASDPCAHTRRFAILPAQPRAKTVGKTQFSENDYFHRGGPSFLPWAGGSKIPLLPPGGSKPIYGCASPDP